MRVPLSWLRELVDVDLSPEQLADRLTVLGMEVQGIERIGADWAHVVVGEILEVAPHPGSTRLSLTRIRTGEGPERAIVCGATNIAAGQRIPVALPGAVLPGDRRIEVTRIAGVESAGMLCSGAELGLTVDADGILILPEGTPVGTALPDLLGDTVLDVDVKPNRGDALCILGLAREVSAATGAPLRRPAISVAEGSETTAARLTVTIEDPRCSRFVGRRVDGVRVGPSPLEIQRRLMAAGMRPVSNVVDASNYVMLELGKPIHTFDAGAIGDGRIIVRAARPGERLETLDHVERTLDPEVLVIADPAGALAIAGVMGGATSEVGSATTSVVIESAIFDPVAIRRTAFRYALRSEASLRFEKGQEHALARTGADRTAQLILAWAGGTATAGVVDTDPAEQPRATVAWRPRRVNRLLGTTLTPEEQQALLGRVEIASAPAPAATPVTIIATEPPVVPGPDEVVWRAEVPGHRRDLAIEADLAEEIARVRGYDALAGMLPSTAMPAYRRDPWADPDMLRGLLAARGFAEVVTHALIGPEDHARLGFPADDPRTIRAENPVTVDHSELRRDLLPSLVAVLADNERQRRADVAIFEIGQVHTLDGRTPIAGTRLGILAAGALSPASWETPGRPAGVASLKELLAWLVLRIGEATLRFTPAAARETIDHPGRTAAVHARRADGTDVELGTVGELDPRYLDACGVRSATVAWADLDLAALLSVVPGRRRIGLPPRFPSVERDLAVVVPEALPAGRVEETIRAAAGPQLAGLRLFDRYRGAPLAADEVSYAWRLRFDPLDEPLDDAALEPVIARIVRALGDALGARLRA